MADFERRVRNYRPAPRALRRRRSGPVRARPTAVRVMSQGSCLVSGHRWAPGKCVTIGNCADLGAVMLIDLPPGYRVTVWPGCRVAGWPLGSGRSDGDDGRCTCAQVSSGTQTHFSAHRSGDGLDGHDPCRNRSLSRPLAGLLPSRPSPGRQMN